MLISTSLMFLWALLVNIIQSIPALQSPLISQKNNAISDGLFADLEELSRIVDIAYCVGLTGLGIQKPFTCASRCQDFEGFELVTTWNTGLFFSDSCGYIAISHPPSVPRIIVAFRGTYSIINTIIDLSTIPQEYVPYPGNDNDDIDDDIGSKSQRPVEIEQGKCTGCTVHAGFMTSWRHTRPYIMPHLAELVEKYSNYRLTFVGHSLGGAVAALGALECKARGWDPQVTTFGEPRIGNLALMEYIDKSFATDSQLNISDSYRRITHVKDPVPLLPLSEWGYRMHAGEIYISKPDLSPSAADIRHCEGDEDPDCIASAGTFALDLEALRTDSESDPEGFMHWWRHNKGFWEVPARFRIWQLFFAHRDYFWRLGVCLPGGDPKDWFRRYSDSVDSEL